MDTVKRMPPLAINKFKKFKKKSFFKGYIRFAVFFGICDKGKEE
jgi:hypothetical protein